MAQNYRSSELTVTVSNPQLVLLNSVKTLNFRRSSHCLQGISVDTELPAEKQKKVNLASMMSKIIILILCCPVHVSTTSSVEKAHSCSCHMVSL